MFKITKKYLASQTDIEKCPFFLSDQSGHPAKNLVPPPTQKILDPPLSTTVPKF